MLEWFQWNDDADDERVSGVLADVLADVLTYCLLLAERIGADPDQIVLDTLAQTREK